MHRRSFLKGISVAPLAVAAAESPQGDIILSSRAGERGYREWCELNGDNMIAKVWLDGIEQKHCIAVDQRKGIVRRVVMTARGNIAHDGDRILEEEVFGAVRVEIVPRRA